MVYKLYILPIGWLYITYHLLREPETAIDQIPSKELPPTTGKNGTIWQSPPWKLYHWSCGAQTVVYCVVNKKWIGRTMSRGMPKHLKMKNTCWSILEVIGCLGSARNTTQVTDCYIFSSLQSSVPQQNSTQTIWCPCEPWNRWFSSTVAIPCCATTTIFVLLSVNLYTTYLAGYLTSPIGNTSNQMLKQCSMFVHPCFSQI